MTFDVAATLRRPAEVLLVVPPFVYHNRPSLGAHLMQGIARRAGCDAQVLYTNMLFAAWFDEGTHNTLSKVQMDLYLAERIFARAAFGGPPLGRDGGKSLVPKLEAMAQSMARAGVKSTFTLEAMLALEAQIPRFLASFAGEIARAGYRVVGCSSSFEQIACSVAILRAVKAAAPATVTVMGGANCEGEMAEGILSLGDSVDHVFSGESETTFAEFLGRNRRGEPSERILHGKPCMDLDALPTPDYADFYGQLQAFLPKSVAVTKSRTSLLYESSRGCWWGAKSHCTFCAFNGEGMVSREKSPARVLAELDALLAAHPVADARGMTQLDPAGALHHTRDEMVKYVLMTDNIMPHAYFRTLLPQMQERYPGVTLWYEQKANLTLKQVRDLMGASVKEIQPGIEALSTGLLKLMAKGSTAAGNLALLRYARATGMVLYWNLLVGFPGDELSFYTEQLEILPLIQHLQPPFACPVVIERFSPYYDHPERYGVTDLRPAPFYAEVFPETADIAKLAYHFEASFPSAAREHPDVMNRIGVEVATWRTRYYSAKPPRLDVVRLGPDRYRLTDTRGLGLPEEQILDGQKAAMALVTRQVRSSSRDEYAWAFAHKLVVERDGKLVPLAIADPDLLAEMESRFRRAADGPTLLPVAV